MMHFLFSNAAFAKDLGLLVLRIGVGLVFIRHGFPKLLHGTEEWRWLGNQMANLGITFAPVMWGFAAACAEFFGGVALVVGFGVRVAAFFMAFVMFVAMIMHIKKDDPWGSISHPLALLFVFIGLMIAGSGRYSLDSFFR